MKIAALSNTDPWADRARRDPETIIEEYSGLEVEAEVSLEQVEILHHGPDRNYRPYLHLSGRTEGLLPREPLVYGIHHISYPESAKPSFDAFMEFTDQDLSDLALKGAWNEGFAIPQIMIDAPWQLPGRIDALVMGPNSADEPPVIFVGLHEQNRHEYDESVPEKASGYDNLVDYFPTPEPEAEAPEAEQEGPSVHEGEYSDIFADVQFLEPDAVDLEHGHLSPTEREEVREEISEKEASEAAVRTGLVPRGVFERLFLDHESVNPTITSIPEPEPAPELVGDERVYVDSVMPRVDEAMAEPSRSEAQIMSRLSPEQFAEAEAIVAEVRASAEPEMVDPDDVIDFGADEAEDPLAPAEPELPEHLVPGGRRDRRHQAQDEIDSQDEDLLRRAGEAESEDIHFGS